MISIGSVASRAERLRPSTRGLERCEFLCGLPQYPVGRVVYVADRKSIGQQLYVGCIDHVVLVTFFFVGDSEIDILHVKHRLISHVFHLDPGVPVHLTAPLKEVVEAPEADALHPVKRLFGTV